MVALPTVGRSAYVRCMRTPPVLTAREAAELIADGATVSVSSSSAIGVPDALLAGIGERFDETSHPADITSLHCINSGEMSSGIKGVDHIAKPGLLRRILGGSFPAGPASLPAPPVREMIAAGQVEAYNIPSGVMYQMHRAAALGQPGVFTQSGVGTYADPRVEGAKMNDVSPDFVRVEHFDGADWLFYPAVPVDVALIRATTADPRGNLTFEEEASPLGALDLAYAAHNNGGRVIAQVKRLSDVPHHPREVLVPGILVDAVVVAPDQVQTGLSAYDPAVSGNERRDLDAIDPLAFSLEKVICRRAAMELAADDVVNLGFGISAGVPLVLLEEGIFDQVTWVIEQGPVGGFPLTGFQFGAAVNPDAIVRSSDQFTLLQGGGFNVGMLSFMEVSSVGDVNVSLLKSRPHATAGIGGFADITGFAPNLVFSGYFTAGKKDYTLGDGRLELHADGKIAKFVPDVAQISYAGSLAAERGQKVRYVTERCVLELRPEGLTVIEIAPGIRLAEDVLDQSAIPLAVADDLALMDARIFTDAPMGLHLAAPRRPLPSKDELAASVASAQDAERE